jgi:hypothetical protein
MTIASEITRINNNIAAAYTALSGKGATMPATQNSANLATTVATVSSGGTTLTATNNSSYDRVTGEKVWLNKSGDDWEIVDYNSADIYSITAKCDENIAINATGSVTLADDGQLVSHYVRDFSLGSGVSEADIDDTGMTFELNNYASSGTLMNKYLVSPQLDLPTSRLGDLLLKVRFKVTAANPGDTPTAEDIYNNLIATTYNNSTTYPADGITTYPNIRAIGESYKKIVGSFRYVSLQEMNVSYGNIVDIDKWITATLRCDNNASPKSLFTVSDALGNTGSATNNNVASSEGNIQRVFIGVRWSTTHDVKTIFDLSQCGLYSADGNTVLWAPYKQSVG